uniref:Uncharacterized protein n=1 Tax=Arundo donax TaxID=35708 RepID=A0A0A9T5S9_ARUDO
MTFCLPSFQGYYFRSTSELHLIMKLTDFSNRFLRILQFHLRGSVCSFSGHKENKFLWCRSYSPLLNSFDESAYHQRL